jgi:hypothetical protein
MGEALNVPMPHYQSLKDYIEHLSLRAAYMTH